MRKKCEKPLLASWCPSARNNLAPTGRIFMKFSYARIFEKSVERIQVLLAPGRKNGYFAWRLSTCMVTSRGGAVGWGTALQAGRWRDRFSVVSLEFFIDIKPSGRNMDTGPTEPLQKWLPWMFPGDKGGRCLGLTALPCLAFWNPHTPGELTVCPGLSRDCFSFFFFYNASKPASRKVMSGRDSSVGIATRYGLDGPGIESAPVQIDPWTHSASCTMGTRSLSRV